MRLSYDTPETEKNEPNSGTVPEIVTSVRAEIIFCGDMLQKQDFPASFAVILILATY